MNDWEWGWECKWEWNQYQSKINGVKDKIRTSGQVQLYNGIKNEVR